MYLIIKNTLLMELKYLYSNLYFKTFNYLELVSNILIIYLIYLKTVIFTTAMESGKVKLVVLQRYHIL